MIRRLYFTFVELLVVMALMVILVGVVGISVNGLVKEQRFKSGVSMVAERLQLAQQLMLIQKNDIQLTFHKDPKKSEDLIIDFNSGKSLSKGTRRLLKKTGQITGIHSCMFVRSDGKQEQLPFSLYFLATDHKISRGTLFLSHYDDLKEEGPLKSSLALTGYVSPFGNSSQQPLMLNTVIFFPKEVMEVWSAENKGVNR